jgi:CheY-like chemotaxis protein
MTNNISSTTTTNTIKPHKKDSFTHKDLSQENQRKEQEGLQDRYYDSTSNIIHDDSTNDNNDHNVDDDELSFLFARNYCVLFVDIVDSTRITLGIDDSNKIRQYYSLFFSSISPIVRSFNAKVLKIIGDCLICYFPRTAELSDSIAFKSVLDCGSAIINASDIINANTKRKGLPSLQYRISADYGRVEIARSTYLGSEDLFGSTMNLCAKMNRMATRNGMVIGANLYRIVKSFSFEDYSFCDVGEYDMGLTHLYSIYSVTSKERQKDNTHDEREKGNFTNDKTGSLLVNVPSASATSNNIHKESGASNNNTPLLPPTAPVSSSSSSLLSSPSSLSGSPRERGYEYKHKHNHHNPCSGVNVMVVDDEPDMLLTFEEFLKLEGHRAEIFTNPQEALKRYRDMHSSYYDLVILDIRMPGVMNGLQLYQQLKVINSDVRVLFISALDAVDEICSIFSDILPHKVVRKPVFRKQFIQKVKSCLADGKYNES